MLSVEENRLLTESSPGTPMGDLLRQFWQPVLLQEELPEPGGAPLRVTVLGEPLLVFRDMSGRLGLVDRRCPHRGADLFFGRNEDYGLRCAYHGWKFDVDGRCIEMPTAAPDSGFKDKIALTAYPLRQAGGMLWAYLGPRSVPPELPAMEFLLLPPTHVYVSKKWQECNWVQSVEGAIDTAHLSFLHMTPPPPAGQTREQAARFTDAALGDQSSADDRIRWVRDDPRPAFTVLPHPAGLLIGAARKANNNDLYWRITQFLMPNHAYAPNAFPGETLHGQTWVPTTDVGCWIYSYSWNPDRPLTDDELAKYRNGFSVHTVVDDAYVPLARLANDFLIDRDAQRWQSYSGVKGISDQDAAIQSSQGAIADRSIEHLGETDIAIIEFRKLMLGAARALAAGTCPQAVDAAAHYAVRCGGWVARKDIGLAEVMRQRFGHEFGFVGGEYGLSW